MRTPPLIADLLRRQDAEAAVAAAAGSNAAFVRRLGALDLILMGVGSIVGAGIFVITGVAAAEYAGPAIIFSFFLAALGCGLAGLCYAELSAAMPLAGSAYAYAYAALGEGVAWLVGWTLISEYLMAGSYVAVGWSGYAANLMTGVGVHLPEGFIHAPLALQGGRFALTGAVVNLPAIFIVLLMTAVARRGIGLAASFNAVIVAVKLLVLLLFIGFGLAHAVPGNWRPFLPPNEGSFGRFGVSGVVRGAAVVFVAYLGFDILSATAQETRNPRRNLPLGLLGSLAICALLYTGVSLALTGLAPYRTLDAPDPLSIALKAAGGVLDWLVPIVDVAAVAGLASVILTVLLALPRILYAMGADGLAPPFFARLHARFRTPSRGAVTVGCAMAVLASLFPIGVLAQMLSLGTLLVFTLVCLCVLILRRTRPAMARPFRAPFGPLVPVLGAGVCLYLLFGLPTASWRYFLAWTLIGMLFYLAVGRRGAAAVRRSAEAMRS